MSQTRILNGAGFLFVSQHLNIIFLWLHKMKRNTKKKTQKKTICTCNHEKTEREREKEGQRKVLRGQQRREGNRPTGITNFNPCSQRGEKHKHKQVGAERTRCEIGKGRRDQRRGGGDGEEKRINDKQIQLNEHFENSSVYQQQSCFLKVPAVY